MKKIIYLTLTLFLFSSFMLFGQKEIDVVYLKNGSILKGIIIENKVNEYIRLKTNDGSVFHYQYDELDKLVIEEQKDGFGRPSQMKDKTGQFGLGILLSSVGSGVAAHYNLDSNTALEFNALMKGVLLDCTYCFEEMTIETAFMAVGSLNHFLKDVYKQHKKKTKRNGISLKAGHSFGYNNESFITVNWIQENIKDWNQNHSFLFELGGGIIKLHSLDEGWVYPNGKTFNFLLNIKVHWNWYLK